MLDLPLQEEKILVVDDEILIAMALETTLRNAGAETIEIATSIEDSHALLDGRDFTVVILDIRLPDGHSYELAADLLERKMPVVLHSGHADHVERSNLPNAYFCPKPSSPKQIINAIMQSKSIMNGKAGNS